LLNASFFITSVVRSMGQVVCLHAGKCVNSQLNSHQC
jgi:hypothetical protein